MTNDPDQLLRERFALTAPAPDPPDWADVVRRADRIGARRPRWARHRVAIVAALLGAVAVAGSAIAISGTSTGIPAIDEMLDRTRQGPFEAATPDSPRTEIRPVPGSLSEPVSFDSAGTRFTAIGFRSEQGGICAALVAPEAELDRPQGGVGCLNPRLLRRALEDSPLHIFAGGGGGGGTQQRVQGFARADVVTVSLEGGESSSSIALSEPWKPEPWDGEPIRFFYTLTDAPEGDDPGARIPPWSGLRIVAHLANGESVEIGP